jgi:hypothetical protein
MVIIGLLVLAGIAAAIAGDGDDADTTPSAPVIEEPLDLPEPPAGSGIDFEVLNCTSEFGFATATVEFTVDRTYDYVEFVGDYTDEDGVSIGQGLGNVTDVVPGQTYRTEVIYSLTGSARGGTCHVRVGDVF